jgi:hypothetical protein
MTSFWLDFEHRAGASVEAAGPSHALDLGEKATGMRPTSARPLYYLAEPVLPGLPCRWPAYCQQPHECAGKNYCTRTPACDS